MEVLGKCAQCKRRCSEVCGKCNGVFYCSVECKDLHKLAHALQCPRDGGVPVIKCTKEEVQHIVALLNTFEEDQINEALQLLLTKEVGKGKYMSVRVRDHLPMCANGKRGCTDGVNLWISRDMLTTKFKPTERELGFTVPKGVEPGTAVILHEFGHILMEHPYRKDITHDIKETRADCWAARFLSLLEQK